MSIARDVELEHDYDRVFQYHQEQLANLKNGVWVSKDGTRHPLSEMSTGHIANCIKMLEQTTWLYALDWVKAFMREIRSRRLRDES